MIKRMHILFCLIASLGCLSLNAQTHLPVGGMNYSHWMPFSGYNAMSDSTPSNQKWHLSKYAAVSAGYSFFNGGGFSYISAPVGLQLTRQLNNNLYAFASATLAPTFLSFPGAFTNPLNQSYPGGNYSHPYQFGMDASVQMGLMYINDAKTFSISGSIGIDRGSYPGYPVYPSNNRMNTKRQ